ncbi:MAG TPA: LysM peptidoglycan-binding domain-containing protein [Streptosporangiaceae bacterium]|nr:LysM peptidoglycan-binding domain-containing protein [Streptosporangiaceae bacterium]
MKSACVMLAWSILPITLIAVGSTGSVHPAYASTRTASSTEVTLTSSFSAPAAPLTTTKPTARYVVRNGDSLSSIATRFAVPGGWTALYAANRRAIGPDPNAIRPGTVLRLPSRTVPARYTVAAGDTLTGIAARLAVPGGWTALYAANRRAVGPDPDAIQPGTVLTVPGHPAAARPGTAAPGTRPAIRPHLAAPSPPPVSSTHRAAPGTTEASNAAMPEWLRLVLLAVGLSVLVTFLAEVLMVAGRRRHHPGRAQLAGISQAQTPSPPPGAKRPSIILADHPRLVVTCDRNAERVFVLRPPGEDPRAILRVARVVLPEGPYGELAKQLGVPAIGPVE